MPRIDGTTNAQTTFLRAFRNNPAGPPPDEWPAPAVLRRWLRRPCFQQALTTLREVLRFRAEAAVLLKVEDQQKQKPE